MKKNILLISLLLICCCSVINVKSQESFYTNQAKYGVFGDYSLNYHSGSFKELPGIPSCCPRYESGTGNGLTFGLLYEFKIFESFNLQTRLVYEQLDGLLTKVEGTTIIPNGTSVAAEFTHSIDSKISSLGIQPLFGYKITDELQVHIGFYIGSITTKTFSQKEQITKPTDAATFLDSLGNDTHSRIRNVFSGDIPQVSSLRLTGVVGVSYDLPLNKYKSFLLVPEVMYSYGFTPVSQNLDWNINTLKIGLALKYSPSSEPKIEYRKEQKFKIDTVRIESTEIANLSFHEGKSSSQEKIIESENEILTIENIFRTDTLFIPKKVKLTADVIAKGVNSEGQESETVEIKIEEFASTLMTPLLNYVFFDENKSEIPERYKLLDSKGVRDFDEGSINSEDRLSTYYHVLNIIGNRLKQNPSTTLKIIGCNSDIDLEKGNLGLSKKRAESVRDYLVKSWGISEKRLSVESRNLPEKAANKQTKDGAEENRRIELIASDNLITSPVITVDTIRNISPPLIKFFTKVENEKEIAEWSLLANQDANSLKLFSGTGEIPTILEWNIEKEKESQPKGELPLTYNLIVKDIKNNSISSEKSIAIKQITISKKRLEMQNDKEIDRFSLVLFDVRSSEISSGNQQIIKLIKNKIKPNSIVNITGFTDRLGDQKANQKLAEERAQSMSNALDLDVNKIVKGLGNVSNYNPDLPEGRLYTRTVDIIVETPVK